MKTRTLTISVLLLAMVLAPVAMAADEPAPPRGPRDGQGGPRQGRGGFGGGPGRGEARLMQQLDLTEEQKEQIDSIREENRTQMQEAQQAVRKANQSLQEAIESGTDEEIMAAAKALGQAYGKQGVLRAQTGRKIKTVLTPEQQAKLKELRTQMRERMQQRMQEGRGGRFRGGPGEGGGQRPPR